MFSNGFHSQAICQPFRKICICLNGFSYLFVVNISLFERLGHPFVENISPFKQLGHHLLKNISLFEGLGLFSIKRLVSSVWKVQDWIVLHYLSHRSTLCKCHKIVLSRNGIMHRIIMFTILKSLSKETIKGTIWQHAKLLEKHCSRIFVQ